MAETKTLTKTLTFGVGTPQSYKKQRGGEFGELTEEQRKSLYVHMIRASQAIAQACNVEAAKRYAQVTLNIDKKSFEQFKPSNPDLRKRIADCEWLAGGTLSQAYKITEAQFKGEHYKDLLSRGLRQLPTSRTDGSYPIPFRKAESLLLFHENKFWLCVALLADKYAKENGLPNWFAYPIVAKKRDKTLYDQLRKVQEKQWELKNTRLLRNMRRKGSKWKGQIVVAYAPDPFKALDPNVVMGIDLGVNVPAAVHIRPKGDPNGAHWAAAIGRGRDLLNSRNVIRSEIKRIIRGLKAKESGLLGKARDGALKRLRELRKREKRVVKTCSQRVASQIAEIARRNGAGVWQVESLGLKGGLKEDTWLARYWAPGTLMDAIRWNAAKYGAELVPVDPAYTSQRCSRCGFISRENRPKAKKGQAFFECVSCGHSENADKNAARNLSVDGIQDLIRAAREELSEE